jgi:DNA-binding XRE family transcriptional regulator
MSLQIIKSIDGKAEYVLLPVSVYKALRVEIDKALKKKNEDSDYIPFELSAYVDNPVALARIDAGMTQEELAKLMGVTQAYVSKLESQAKVGVKVLKKVSEAIKKV